MVLFVFLFDWFCIKNGIEYIYMNNEHEFAIEFNYTIKLDYNNEMFTLIMIGPINSWMNIGFGNIIMDNSHSIVYSYDNILNQWNLGHHNDGIIISLLIMIYSYINSLKLRYIIGETNIFKYY